jgi:hypothetical protein
VERIVRGRSATLTKTFTFTPTGTPSVVVTNSAGAAVTTGSVSGATTTWTYTIPATSNTLLDTYTATWTAVTGGENQTFTDTIEVAGDTLFTLAEFRSLVSGTFTDDEIIDMRTTVEQELEQACGVAFVPRYALETLDGSGGRSLMLRPMLRVIRSASVDDSTFSVSDLAYLTLSTTGTIYSASRTWSAGTLNVVVGYEHGYPSVPLGIRRAALMLAKMWLVGNRSPIDDRAATFSATEGGTYSLVVPGRNGSHVGHPDVDAAIDRYSLRTGIA